MSFLDKFCHFSGELPLLPGVTAGKLKVEDNAVCLEDWMRCLRVLGFDYLCGFTHKRLAQHLEAGDMKRRATPCYPRLFPNDRVRVTLGKVLFILLAARQKTSFKESENASRMTMRVLHMFCQSVQRHLESGRTPLLTECPEPSRCSSYHPLLKYSRLRGSTVLKEKLVNRFSKKSSGFLSTKDDLTLADLGLFSENYRLSSQTTSEFLIRYLVKSSNLVQSTMDSCEKIRVINFCMDAARACTHQAYQILDCACAQLHYIFVRTLIAGALLPIPRSGISHFPHSDPA